MFSLGWQETMFIFILALLLFGPKKLPELGRTIGKAMGEFRRASADLKATWDRQMHELDRENQSLRETASQITSDLSPYHDTYRDSDYGSSYHDSGVYGQESSDQSPSTDSASAPQGAESTQAASTPAPAGRGGVALEGTLPRGGVALAKAEPSAAPAASERPADGTAA